MPEISEQIINERVPDGTLMIHPEVQGTDMNDAERIHLFSFRLAAQ
jgi:hypothetical protein